MAEGVVTGRLAACVSIIPSIKSTYVWQGVLEKSEEYLLLAKTTESSLPELQTWLKEHHPYELPEIIAVPIRSGLPDYLEWVGSCVRPS